MKWTIFAVMLILAGCGDTINQAAPASANKLVIKSATFGIYSAKGTAFSVYYPDGSLATTTTTQPQCWIDGKVIYEGDPQGVIVSMAGSILTYFPIPNLMPGNVLRVRLDIQQSEVQIFKGQPYTLTLTDPHGNDSNPYRVTP
jgi:hypothetical protein